MTLDRIWLGLVLVLTLVFGYAGGVWIAYPLMVATVLSLVALVIRRWPVDLRQDWAGPAFLSAFVLLAISFAVNADIPHAFNFLMFALFIPLNLALSRHAAPRNAFYVALLANIGCVVGLVVACYQVFVLQMGRASAFGSDPIWSAQAGIIIAFIALLGVMTTEKPWRLSFFVGPLAMVFVVVLSGSRGPLLAVPLLMVLFVVLGTKHWWRNTLASAAGILVLGLAVALIWPEGLQRFLTVKTLIVDMLGNGPVTEASGSERQQMYSAGLEAFFASPMFGYGWKNLLPSIQPFLNPNALAFVSIHHHLHNDGLDFAVSGGIPGLVAYGLVLLAPLLGTLRSPRDSQYNFRRVASIGLVVGYIIFGISYLTFGYEYHTTLYVVLSAILVGFCRDSSGQINKKPVQQNAAA